MKQFAHRHAVHPGATENLKKKWADLLVTPTLVPETGIASWNLYYFCPEHSVRLRWDRHSPHHHCCPVDGRSFSGEPYDSAWWREMNGQNASACYHLGLLWQLTGDAACAAKVAEILRRYADYYPGYEVHGDIPHNGPGKMNAQTLCEANCLLEMALGYDFIADSLSATEREHICDNLLRPAARFLQAHRSPQIHNHEVKINAAIAVLGFILEEDALIEFAVNQQYGLRWQLENGLLDEGLWFEGSIHYHYYALQGFMAFEKLARGSRWSLLDLPYYRKMLDFPLSLLMPDGTLPLLNDCLAGQEKLYHRDVYEFAWQVYRDPLYARVLHFIGEEDDAVDTLLWRDAPLPVDPTPLIPQTTTFAPAAGLTVWRKPRRGQALLIKHSPYGGEHDHYDRLNVLLWDNHVALLPDLGTTGYGAKMHYAYYKNSATHNTLSVNQTNQPPAQPQLLSWHHGDDFYWMDSLVDWRKAPDALNSHTRVEWDAVAWRDILFRRRLLWLDDVLIDLSDVHNPHAQQLDWTLHLAARALDQRGEAGIFATQGPLCIMRNATVCTLRGCQPRHFAGLAGEHTLWLAGDADLWQGTAPGNPAVSDLSYVVLRSHQSQARFLAVWDFCAERPLTAVKIDHDERGSHITLCRGDHTRRLSVPAGPGELPHIEG